MKTAKEWREIAEKEWEGQSELLTVPPIVNCILMDMEELEKLLRESARLLQDTFDRLKAIKGIVEGW